MIEGTNKANMESPFFSIVIPTHNRPKLFGEALQSALLQDFDDFEVIVSDNSSDTDTPLIISSYQNERRLRVVKPDQNMSMPEHWEFATLKARGRYVLILTDRSVLKRKALLQIYEAILAAKQEVEVCSWRWTLFDEVLNLEFADIPVFESGRVSQLTSASIVERFSKGKAGNIYELPRGLNSCYSRSLADKIRMKHGTLFKAISPDFTSAFLLLAYVENLLFIDEAVFISQGLTVSNGGNASKSISAALRYLATLNVSDYYAHVPIKLPLVENLIFEDFLSIQTKTGWMSNTSQPDWEHYFVTCYIEIVNITSNLNSDVEYKNLMNEWSRALCTFDSNTQQEVRSRTSRLKGTKFKALIRNSFFGAFISRIRRRLSVRGQSRKKILGHAGFSV